MKSGKR